MSGGGWALEMFGQFSSAGEQYAFRDLRVTVVAVEEQRILSLRVEKLSPPDEADAGKDAEK